VRSLRQLLELRVSLPVGFSDDAGSVLLLSNRPGTMQLYWAARTGGELEQLTDFDEPVCGQCIPDSGGRIVLSIDEGGNERAQLFLLHPGGEPQPFAVDRESIHRSECTSFDGRLVGFATNKRNGVDFDVYVQPIDGEARVLAELGGWCDTVGFSPDGRWLAVAKLTDRSGDNDLYLVDVENGEVVHVSPHDDDAVFEPPVWRSDSCSFLFAASTGRDTTAIARYDLGTRRFEYVLEDEWDLSAHGDRSGRHLVVEANEDGYSRVELRDPETLELRARVPLPGRGVAGPFVFSRDGRFLAYHFTSPREPGDAWLYDTETGETTRLTWSAGDDVLEALPEPELHRYESFDGESIPVFLYLPDRPDPAPVIVNIHGGPEGQARPIWGAVNTYWVSRGFAVAVPNVRGSTGYGKRYEHLDDRFRRLDSVRDVAALHDWLASNSRVDPSRIALAGGSYGGYMVLAGLAFHPEKFAAGVDIVGISSLVTFLENTSVWRRAFREREYGYLATDRAFLEQVSPITHVDEIRVPLLIVHGANDPRVPLSEAEQLHAELERRGVPSELIVYDDEGHGLQKLKNRLDAYPRVVDFLVRVLEPAAVSYGPVQKLDQST
jgi:dipeptidyl aminopeptidase/acylaminoacyl peptidase